MPEVHSSLRLVNTRMRGLSTATAGDEPIPKSQLDSTPGGGLQSIAAGDGILVDDGDPLNPVVSVDPSQLPNPPFARETVSIAASAARTSGTVEMARTSQLFRVASTGRMRLRIYDSVAARDADANRVLGGAPAIASGLLFEGVTTATLGAFNTSPVPLLANNEPTPTRMMPFIVDALDGLTQTVTLTFTEIAQ